MLQGSRIAGFVGIKIKLPGRTTWTDLGLRKIENEVLDLPLPLAFLCHAEEDQEVVRKIGTRLEEDGIVTWFAPSSLLGGADWKSEIDGAIETADFIVVFLSKKSATKRGYFQREVKRAFELRDELPDGERFIIPALIDEVVPPARFDDIHWVRLYEPDGYAQLKASLTDLEVPTS